MHRLIQRILHGIRILRARRRGRRLPVTYVLPDSHAHDGRPSGPPYPDYGPDVEQFYDSNAGAPNVEQAVRDIMIPAHEQISRTRFGPVAEGGSVDTRSERWVREGNRMRVTIEHARIVDASQRLVAVRDLTIRCSLCGGYDSTGGHCQVCGRALCGMHGVLCQSESGAMAVLCPEHFAAMAEAWDTWSASDARSKSGRYMPTCPGGTPISSLSKLGAHHAAR